MRTEFKNMHPGNSVSMPNMSLVKNKYCNTFIFSVYQGQEIVGQLYRVENFDFETQKHKPEFLYKSYKTDTTLVLHNDKRLIYVV